MWGHNQAKQGLLNSYGTNNDETTNTGNQIHLICRIYRWKNSFAL